MKQQNPIIRNAAARAAIAELNQVERHKLARILEAIGADAEDTAQRAWRQRKGPMANYWLATGVNARHIARALRLVPTQEALI